jgi:nucleotide-binding universal stress UspA family protein
VPVFGKIECENKRIEQDNRVQLKSSCSSDLTAAKECKGKIGETSVKEIRVSQEPYAMPNRTTLKRIVVASDLSIHADLAVRRALQLAAMHGAEVDFVHIIEEGLPAQAQDDQRASSERSIQEELAKISSANKVKVTIDLVVGCPDLDIVEQAERFDADCIVLGFHDSILEENRSIEGTLAETVIANSKVPVLLVKNEPSGPYRNVVVGVDLAPSPRAAMQAAVLIAPEAKLHFVHAYEGEGEGGDEPDENLETAKTAELEHFIAEERRLLTQAASKAGLPSIESTAIAKQGEPLQVLQQELKARNGELVVLSTHGRTGWIRAIMGSVTTDIINERLYDVLVICPE